MKIFLVIALMAITSAAARIVQVGSSESDESEECPSVCKQSKPLSIVGGGAEGGWRNKNYYYNHALQKCRSFNSYGLQRSNTGENRFLDRDACEYTCAHTCSGSGGSNNEGGYEGQYQSPPRSGGGRGRILSNGMQVYEFATSKYKYVFQTSTMSWDQAMSLCQNPDIGGSLVAVQSEAEDLEMVTEVGSRISNDAWISGKRENSCSKFTWMTTGQELGSYNHWANHAQSQKVGCIFYKRHPTEGLAWFVDDCSLRKAVLCQVPLF